MNGNGLLTGAVRLVAVVLGVGVLAWAWTQAQAPERPTTTKTWVNQLQARDAEERKAAVQELRKAGVEDVAMVNTALIGALGDREASVRNDAALALLHCLVAALKAPGADVTDQARAAAVALMAATEQDGDRSVRASAAFAAANLLRGLKEAGIKPDDSKAHDPIDPRTLANTFDAVLERDPEIRPAVLASYQKLGPIDAPAPAALLAALDDPSRVVRRLALMVLSQFASGLDQAVPVLLKEAAEKDARDHPSEYQAGYSLRQAAENLHATPAVVPILIKGLESRDADVSDLATVMLGRLGPAARSAAPALVAAAKAIVDSSRGSTQLNPSWRFSDLATTIVRVLPAEEAVATLREAMSPDHSATQFGATRALGELRSRGEIAVPILLEALKDSAKPGSGAVREGYAYGAFASLREIALEAPLSKAMVDAVIEAVSQYLDYPEIFVRAEAANTLGAFAHRASAVLPRLRALQEDLKQPIRVREAALMAIEKISEFRRALP